MEEKKNVIENNMRKKDLRRIAIHCKTEEEAIRCCELANKLGWKWSSGEKFSENSRWNIWKSDTCYNFYYGIYNNYNYCVRCDYRIESAQWFIDNFTPKKTLADVCKNSQDNIKALLRTKFSDDELSPDYFECFINEYVYDKNIADVDKEWDLPLEQIVVKVYNELKGR